MVMMQVWIWSDCIFLTTYWKQVRMKMGLWLWDIHCCSVQSESEQKRWYFCCVRCESSALFVISVLCFTLKSPAGHLDANTLRLRACGLSADPVSNVAHWLPWCCRKWEDGKREEGPGLLSLLLLSCAHVLNHTFTLILTFLSGAL